MDRTHEAYALGYYHGRTQGVTGVPDRRTVELLDDYYRLGYARGLKDQWAEQPVTEPIDLGRSIIIKGNDDGHDCK
jgi:hypothetical protein